MEEAPSFLADECAICLGSRCEDPCLCSCGHAFCFECIKQTRDNRCPICRKEHQRKFVLVESGDIVEFETPKTNETWREAFVLTIKDNLLYLLLLVSLLPFLAGVFTLGCVWALLRETLDLISGRRKDYPALFRYQRWPRIAPHGIDTSPPPWSSPALWEH